MPSPVRLLACLVSTACASLAAPPAPAPMPAAPAWTRDVTASLRLVSGLAPGEGWARSAPAPIFPTLARHIVWEGDIALPATDLDWPVALEFDEARVLRGLSFQGGALPLPVNTEAVDLQDGRAAVVLPLSADLDSGRLRIEANGSTAFFANGFGRARLRPATLPEVLRLTWNDGRCTVVNQGPLDLEAVLHVRHEDFFGVALHETTTPFAIGSGLRRLFQTQPPSSPALHKTIAWLVVGDKVSPPHWHYHSRGRELRQRDHVLVLRDNWQFNGAGDSSNPPPDGWEPVRLPHQVAQASAKTRAFWYRTRLKVPSEWPAARSLHLVLGRVQYRAELWVNGRCVTARDWWDLPAHIPLPAGLRPGDSLELSLRVTDYTIALSPEAPQPAPGEVTVPNRGLAAPIGPAWNQPLAGLPTIPEMYSAPATRVESVALRTTREPATGAWRLAASATIRNDADSIRRPRVRFTVLRAGEVLASRAFHAPVDVVARGSTELSWQETIDNAAAWAPGSPALHEFRAELIDLEDRAVDAFRERFGFRDFETRREGFFLNGHRVRLHGGSHIAPEYSLWPVRLAPHTLLRYDFGLPDQFLGGSSFRHAAEELGYLIKAAAPEHNAHGNDRYAYERPEFWDRARSHFANHLAELRNSPSIVIWDLGNEVSFQRPGDADRMQALADHLRSIDPAREVTIGGSAPGLPRSSMANLHGGGFWNNRLDHFFLNPEDRPSYLHRRGLYHHLPASEPASDWTVAETWVAGFTPRAVLGTPKLTAYDGRPILWAEGHYVGEGDLSMPALLGHDFHAPFVPRGGSPWERRSALDSLQYLAGRRHSIATVRQAGSDGSMIHVDRGFGRAFLPLAALPYDRKFRARDGQAWVSEWTLINDLSSPTEATVIWRLVAAEDGRLLGESGQAATLLAGDMKRVTTRIDLPALGRDTDARLEVTVTTPAGLLFDEVHPFAVLAPTAPAPLPGRELHVYDPSGLLGKKLAALGVSTCIHDSLTEWPGGPAAPLLVGPEALSAAAGPALARLRAGILEGALVAVLDHRELPGFVPATLAQSDAYLSFAAPTDPVSPLLRGLRREDFQFWQTRERDQLVVWKPVELPSSGNFRHHADAGGPSALLELQQGQGRVLLCQLNLRDALGLDPAADRLFVNLLDWFTAPSPFARKPAAIVTTDPRLPRALQGQYGVDAELAEKPSADLLASRKVVLTSGTDADTRAAFTHETEAVRAWLAAGGTLFVQGLDAEGAAWLTQLAGTPISVEDFAQKRAMLTGWHELTRGTLHSPFFFAQERKEDFVLPEQKLPAGNDSVGHVIVTGEKVRPLLLPAYLVEIPRGEGRIVVSTLRSLDYPTRNPRLAYATVLNNLGLPMVYGGVTEGAAETVSWVYHPLDLSAFYNLPLRDQPDGRIGYHGGGPQNDLGHLPQGRVTLEGGVEYLLAEPAKTNGNGVIALSGTKEKGILPAEVKGIPVNRKADRLYFLHNSAWGQPGFTYRVWYEERKTWIFGRPDPFVDVVVKPGENIADWYDATQIARGESFAPGLTIAWKAANPTSALNGREVGVYQMVWNNPHPEKSIESIDILSPGIVGSGQVFVFGVTAATRADAPPAKPAPPLAKVAPGVREAEVAETFFNGRYGLVLLKNGEVPSIFDERGVRLVNLPGWTYVGQNQDPTGRLQQTDLETQRSAAAPTIRRFDESGATVFELTGRSRHFDWNARFICRSAALDFDLRFTQTSLPEGRESAVVHWPVRFNRAEFGTPGPKFDWKDNPQMVPFKTGIATLGREQARKWFKTPGYFVSDAQDVITHTETLNFTVGTTATMTLILTLP